MIQDNDEFAKNAAPIRFLAQRANLAQMRNAIDLVSVSDEARERLDRILEETEALTQMFLLRTPLPEGEWLDEVFDDEFLELCKTMRVNLLAWINQPQILLRLRDPDAILLRFDDVSARSREFAQDLMSSTASFSERVDEMVSQLTATFSMLRSGTNII